MKGENFFEMTFEKSDVVGTIRQGKWFLISSKITFFYKKNSFFCVGGGIKNAIFAILYRPSLERHFSLASAVRSWRPSSVHLKSFPKTG